MAQTWQPVEQIAKNDQGEYVALMNGNWFPVPQAAKNAQGQYMALIEPQTAPASQRLSTGDYFKREAGLFPRAVVEAAPTAVLGVPALAADAYDALVNATQMGLNKLGVSDRGYYPPFRHSQALVQGGTELANKLNLPEYETPQEQKLYNLASAAMSATGGASFPAKVGAEMPATKLGYILRNLGERPLMQGASAASSSAGGSLAKEAGFTPEAQTAASFVAGLAPYMAKNAVAPNAATMRPEKVKTAQDAMDLGLKIPPNEMNPTLPNRMLEGASGKIATRQMFSVENQKIIDRIARAALNLPEDANLDDKALNPYRAAEYAKGYEPVKQLGALAVPKDFNAQLDKISGAYKGQGTVPATDNPKIQEIVNAHKRRLGQGPINSADAVDAIRILRQDATSLFKKGDDAEAFAKQKIANIYEDLIDKNLQIRSSQPFNQANRDLLQNYRDARKNIAVSHTIDEAVIPGTGEVDASKLAAALNRGEPLSDDLLKIAKFANAFKGAAQTPSKVGSPAVNNLRSQIPLAAGTITGAIGKSAGAEDYLANIALPAYGATKLLIEGVPVAARKIMASPAFQARVLRAAAGKGPTAEKVAMSQALGISLEDFSKASPAALAAYLRNMSEGQE